MRIGIIMLGGLLILGTCAVAALRPHVRRACDASIAVSGEPDQVRHFLGDRRDKSPSFAGVIMVRDGDSAAHATLPLKGDLSKEALSSIFADAGRGGLTVTQNSSCGLNWQ